MKFELTEITFNGEVYKCLRDENGKLLSSSDIEWLTNELRPFRNIRGIDLKVQIFNDSRNDK